MYEVMTWMVTMVDDDDIAHEYFVTGIDEDDAIRAAEDLWYVESDIDYVLAFAEPT